MDQETKEIVTREPQFSLLKRAWDLLLTGPYTVPQIRDELWKWGYSSASKHRERRIFSESHLYRLFDNPFYCGSFTFRGQTFEGKHQAMITADEFRSGQRIIHGESKIQPKKHEFPFTGLIRCNSCGCAVTAERKVKYYRGTNRTVAYEYYRCTRRRGVCGEPAVPASLVEQELAEKLDQVCLDRDFGEWLLTVVDREISEDLHQTQAIEAGQSESLDSVQLKLSRLIDLRVSGEITPEEFTGLRERYGQEARELSFERDAVRRRQLALKRAIRFGMSAGEAFKSEEVKVKRHVAQVFVSKAVLTQGRLVIEPHPLLALVAGLEPPQLANDMVGTGTHRPVIPSEWAWRERIRTLLPSIPLPQLDVFLQPQVREEC